MRILYLASGAGEMYCGSCLQGNTLVAAVRKAGEDAILAPLYTPLRTDEDNQSIDRMAYGGVNVFLQQRWALFRHTPWFLDRLLDRPRLLRWLGRRSAAVRPEALGELTVSMLRGEEGRQRKELDKLIDWARREIRPRIVHLSSVLLAGLARQIARRLEVPVVATLSGEDLFLDGLAEPYRREALAVLGQRCGDLAALIAPNRYYARHMTGYLGLRPELVHVIPLGLNLAGHATAVSSPLVPPREPGPAGRRVVGYLARICPEKGLHLLVEATELLAADPNVPPFRVLAAGYLGPADRPYLKKMLDQVERRGWADRFVYLGELSRVDKLAFLQSLDVMAMPTAYPESKGLPVLEAWANGVPVVVPEHGAFPEMIADSGGGLLFKPGDARSLAERLAELLSAPQQAAEHGRRGQQAVGQHHPAELIAQRTIALYRELLEQRCQEPLFWDSL
jgi:glycosyltransferase involved in cell wall biosynthesis